MSKRKLETTPAGPNTRASRQRFATNANREAGQRLEEVVRRLFERQDMETEPARSPGAGGEDPEDAPEARNDGVGGSTGGTMVSGGMRSTTSIPPSITDFNGTILCTQHHRYTLPVLGTWEADGVTLSQLYNTGQYLNSRLWNGGWFCVPDMACTWYLGKTIRIFLDKQCYWKTKHAGWKINKIDIHRRNETLPNATTPQIRVDSSWQPQLLCLKHSNKIPCHVGLQYQGGTTFNQDLERVDLLRNEAIHEVQPQLPKAYFNMASVISNNQTTFPPLPERDNTANTNRYDYFAMHATKHEMNDKGILVEKRCFPGWRRGHDKFQSAEHYADVAPPFALAMENRSDTLAPSLPGTANSNLRANDVVRRPTWTNTVDESLISAIGTAATTQMRNDKDGYMPHMNDKEQGMTYVRMQVPPNIGGDSTEWFAVLDVESEAVMEWDNELTFTEERFDSQSDFRYMGDRRMTFNRYIDVSGVGGPYNARLPLQLAQIGGTVGP